MNIRINGEINMAILQKIGRNDQHFITIPKSLVKAKGWEKGDNISILIVGPNVMPREGDIILRPSGL